MTDVIDIFSCLGLLCLSNYPRMTQKKIIVLGAGLIGKAVAIELSKEYDVTSADIQLCSLEALSPQYPVTVIPCDFKDIGSLKQLISPFDLVVNAVSSSICFETLKTIISEKKNVINVSLFSEDINLLNKIAEENNIMVYMNNNTSHELIESSSSAADFILSKKMPRSGIVFHENELVIE